MGLSSCEFGANAVDGAAIQPEEGSVFVYDNLVQFNFRSPEQLGPQIEIRLLSKVASIGGRDNVLGFQSSADGELIFTDIEDGQILHFFTANRDFEKARHRTGEWIRIPGDGDEPVFATIEDSVAQFDPEFPTPITRELAIRPAGQFKFYVDGYYFNARKVKVTSTYDTGRGGGFGEVLSDEQELTFIEGIGVLAEKITRESFGSEITHFVMSDLELQK